MKIVRNIKVVIIPCDPAMTHGLMPYLHRDSSLKEALDTDQLRCVVVDEGALHRDSIRGICRANLSTAFVMVTAKEGCTNMLDRLTSAIEKYTEEDI